MEKDGVLEASSSKTWIWLGLMVLAIAALGGFVVYKARGLRNRNPGNIRPLDSGEWEGQVGIDNGPGGPFVIFSSFFYGLRALARILMNYQAKNGLRTVGQMINRWAPSSENDTSDYVQTVAAALGVSPDDSIDVVNNQAQLLAMMGAIVTQENGVNPFTDERLANSASDARIGIA